MARKDAIELEGTVVELLPNTMFRVQIPGRRRVLAYLRQNASTFHSDLARRQSYATDFTLRFVERANYLSPKMTARRAAAVSISRIMKVRPSVKRLCASCRVVKRKNVLRVICKNPR